MLPQLLIPSAQVTLSYGRVQNPVSLLGTEREIKALIDPNLQVRHFRSVSKRVSKQEPAADN